MKRKLQLYFVLIFVFVITFNTVSSQTIIEAEDAFYSAGKVDNKHTGFTGDGFVDTENAIGVYIEWFVNVPNSITDTLKFKYALGKEEHRFMDLFVNDVFIETIDFDNTIEFTSYLYKNSKADLIKGINRIKLVAQTAEGAPNLDHLCVSTQLLDLPYFDLEPYTDGNGNVQLEPYASSYRAGSRVTLTAVPSSGFMFNNWTGDIAATENPMTIVVDDNIAVTANFINSMPAFPGAEGYAFNISGGRGGAVYEVTNLNDSGVGSLRYAIEQTGTRTIVFRVSGLIRLKSDLKIRSGNLTIAGQTAPGDGICIADQNFSVNASNVIIRFLRFRLGDITQQSDDDAFTCNGVSNVIIDHCSFSWGVDETASMYRNKNAIMQWCIATEGLNASFHVEDGVAQEHGYGGIWGGIKSSFHHNLISNQKSRMPRFNGARFEANWPEQVDFRNNVIYNWRDNNSYGGEPSEIDGSKAKINVVNNYYKSGTNSNKPNRIVDIDADGSYGYSNWHVSGNSVYGFPAIDADNKIGVHGITSAQMPKILVDEPFDFIMSSNHTAVEAYEHVLAYTGCVLPVRDVVDTRIINEVRTRTTTYGTNGIINSQEDVGGWPVYNSTTPPVDTDKDGMPDDWENARSLNPNDAADGILDNDGDGYTNLEEYLNEIVAQYKYILRPVNFSAIKNDQSGVSLSWDAISTDATGYVIERSLGDVFSVIATLDADVFSYTDADMLTTGGATYTYRIKAINGDLSSLYTDEAVVSFNTSIKNINMNDIQMEVYPNPFDNKLVVAFYLNASENVSFALFDITGRKKAEIPARKYIEGENKVDIDWVSKLTNGMYYLVVKSDSKSVSIPVCK